MVEAVERQVNRKYNSSSFQSAAKSTGRTERNFCPPDLDKPHHSVFKFDRGLEVGTCINCGHIQEIGSKVDGERLARDTYDGTIRDNGGLRSSLAQIVRRAGPISSSYD